MEQQQYDSLMQRFDRAEDKIDRILVQATKTNGRVNFLEKEFDKVCGEVKDLSRGSIFNKGRDKTVWVVLVFLASAAGMLFQYYLSTKK